MQYYKLFDEVELDSRQIPQNVLIWEGFEESWLLRQSQEETMQPTSPASMLVIAVSGWPI